MPENQRTYTQVIGYDLQVWIKDLDYTADLFKVAIISSLSTAYPIVILSFMLDQNDIVLEDIFGGTKIKFTVQLLTEEGQPYETITFNLMYVISEFPIAENMQTSEGRQKDRVQFTITTVCRDPFTIMNTFINDIYIGQNIRGILSDLSSKVNAPIYYDFDGENKETIDQICIPPTTLYKIIKEFNMSTSDENDGYLDQRFGLFDGVAGVFCTNDNEVYVKNLTKKLEKNQNITIYQIVEDKNNNEVIQKSLSGNIYYTYAPIKTDHAGNAKIAVLAPTMKTIVKPKDSLTHTITKNLSDVYKQFSCAYQNKELIMDSAISVDKRIRYFINDTGNDYSETQFNSRYGRSLSDMSTISIKLERNITLENLLNVGECVKFNVEMLELIEMSGKYILWSSDINFQKKGEWEATATVNLMRSNKKI